MNWLYWNYIRKYYNNIKKNWESQDKETKRCVYFTLIFFSFILSFLYSPILNYLFNRYIKNSSLKKTIQMDPHHLGEHRYIPNQILPRN